MYRPRGVPCGPGMPVQLSRQCIDRLVLKTLERLEAPRDQAAQTTCCSVRPSYRLLHVSMRIEACICQQRPRACQYKLEPVHARTTSKWTSFSQGCGIAC